MLLVFDYTFEGHVPSKKNNRIHTGSKVIPSKAHKAWYEKAAKNLPCGSPKIYPPYRIQYRFFPGSLMSFDLSNSLESINDFLVDHEIITEDNWKVLRSLEVSVESVVYSKPRVEVKIYQLDWTAFDEALEILSDKDKLNAVATRSGLTKAATTRKLKLVLSDPESKNYVLKKAQRYKSLPSS